MLLYNINRNVISEEYMGKNKNLRTACDIYGDNLLQILMIDLNSEEIDELKNQLKEYKAKNKQLEI